MKDITGTEGLEEGLQGAGRPVSRNTRNKLARIARRATMMSSVVVVGMVVIMGVSVGSAVAAGGPEWAETPEGQIKHSMRAQMEVEVLVGNWRQNGRLKMLEWNEWTVEDSARW